MSVAFNIAKALLPRTPNAPNDEDVCTFPHQTSGALVLIIIAMISLIAVAGLLTAIAASAWNTRKSPNPNLFVRTNIAPYFIMLLLSNLLQSIAGMMSTRWVLLERIEPGPFCTSQGAFKYFSSVALAVWSLIIAIHTFHVLFFRVSIKRWITYTTVVVANVLLVLLACIGFVIGHAPGNGPFYGVAEYWCWITDEYKGLRILLEYLIMYVSALISFILYLLVFFRMRGNITVHGWRIRFRMNTKGEDGMRREYTTNVALRVAKQMLLYPVVYTFLILPLAVVRSYGWSGRVVSCKLVFFPDVVFQAAGLVNVILFTTMRRLLPWRSVVPWNRAVRSSSQFTPQRTFPVLKYGHDIFLHPVSQENETEKAEEPTSGESPSHHVKIDNHIDNMLTYSHNSQLDLSQIDVP